MEVCQSLSESVALSASWENPKACLVLVPATDCVILNVVVGKPHAALC